MREKERSTRLIFVRHGETDFPLDRIYCDEQDDPALNGVGVDQANQAAEQIKPARVDALYASPCLRTRMTAAAVNKAYPDLTIEYDERLRERHFGIWEGLYFSEIEREFPLEYKRWKQDQAAFRPQGGESVYEMAGRVVSAVKDIVVRHPGQAVVVVAHVGPIRVLVTEALGMSLKSYRQLRIDPASITVIDYGLTQNNLILLNYHARHWRGEGDGMAVNSVSAKVLLASDR